MASDHGHFEGLPLEVRWLLGPDPRKDWNRIEMLKSLQYIDPDQVEWDAPAGVTSDGASIPRLLWTTVGSPFTGKYLPAAVVHDVACSTMYRTWESTHLAFYRAMLASHVATTQARIMYSGVYMFGPRWPHRQEVRANGNSPQAANDLLQMQIDWIKKEQTPRLAPGTKIQVLRGPDSGPPLEPGLYASLFGAEAVVLFEPPPPVEDTTVFFRFIRSSSIRASEPVFLERLSKAAAGSAR